MMLPTRMDAAREVLRRQRAAESLVDYSQAVTIPGAPTSEDVDSWVFRPVETDVAAHHVVIMRAIEHCIRTDYGRLMIFAPPGSAKSTYASVVGTTWAMGAFPGLRVLMTSYAATPIVRHSKRARQIVAGEQYASIWPDRAQLVADSRAADEWELTNGSGMYAAGLMGGLTSSRADLGIIDDPVAGREEAESETTRAKTKAAYEDDFLTRLKPKASIILIQTRWHQSDLAGGLLPEDYDGRSGSVQCRDGQTWEVVNIAACCERNDDPVGREVGEYLWPEWFGPSHWAIYKANARTWAALYQQRPAPDEGIYFKREDFLRYPIGKYPTNLQRYMASDFAVKDRRDSPDPDFTEHGVFGVDETGDIWITDWWYGQKDTAVSIDAALDLVQTSEPVLWFGESGVIESAIEPALRSRMQARRVYAARELLPSIGDKVARSRGFSARVSARTIHVPSCEWGDRIISQLCAFPAGRYDDGVDVCGLIGRGIDKMANARKPVDSREKPIIPFTRRHIESIRYSDEQEQAERRNFYR